MKKLKCSLLAALAALMLVGCGAFEPKPEPTTEPPVEEVALVVTADTISQLEDYPALKKADLTGSDCYAAIEAYRAAHPEVEVEYTVDVGGTPVPWNASELSLCEGSYDAAVLLENLPHLPELQALILTETQRTREELDTLAAQVPLDYTVEFYNQVYARDTAWLDLSAMTSEELPQILPRLTLVPEVENVELMAEDGTALLTLEEAILVQEALPDAQLHFAFDLFGKQVSTDDEEIYYKNQYIGNKIEGAEDTLRRALTILRGCKRFVLDNCYFPNDTLAEIRDEFRDTTKLVWRVWFGTDGNCLTDREVIRYMPTLTGDNSKNLIYCEDARFIDVGHDTALFRVDFVAGMPKLEAIIVSGAPISDLSPFAACESLEFLEIAYCQYVTDLSPIANCKNLKRLNIAYTGITDLSPLDGLPLEVMVDTHSKVPMEERLRFDTENPDCLIQHSGEQPYGYPWRYTDPKHLDYNHRNDYYAMLWELFDYDHPTQTRG